MTAAAHQRQQVIERWTHHLFPLLVGTRAWKGAACGLDSLTGKVQPMAAGLVDLVHIGTFDEDVDATGAEWPVQVDLGMELEVRRYANDGAGLVDAADVGSICNFLDDQTVTMGSGPIAGRVWHVDPVLGVAVEKLPLDAVAAPALP
jgi:hypothetical protein